MVRTWISPDGDWSQYIATSQAAHLDRATEILGEEVAAGRIDPEDYGPPSQTESEALISHGWVRYSEGNVDAMPDAIAKHWGQIRDFLQSDTLRYGYFNRVFFDLRDERGHVVRSFSLTMREADSYNPPGELFRESSRKREPAVSLDRPSIEGYMPSGRAIRYGDRRPRKVRVRSYHRSR